MTSLFIREPETLDGYTPRFTREETRLNHRFEKIQVKKWDDDEPDEFVEYHYITVAGVEFQGHGSYYMQDDFDIAVSIANDVLKNYKGEKYEGAQAYLRENADQLNCSKRYWKSWDHLQKILAVEAKAKALLDQAARARIIASVNALEVRAGRSFSSEERQILLAEFNGGEFKADES